MALYCMQPPQRKYAAEVPIFLCAAVRDKPDEKMDSLIVPKVVWRIDGMAIEKVKEYFKTYNMADRIQEFTVSSATVELAAQALQRLIIQNIKQSLEQKQKCLRQRRQKP